MSSDSDSNFDDEEFHLYSKLYFEDSNENCIENGNDNYNDCNKKENHAHKPIVAAYQSNETGLPLKNTHMRKRNLSICSIGSISGKIPLDELYCTAGDSDCLSPIEEDDNEPSIDVTPKADDVPTPVSKYDMNCSKSKFLFRKDNNSSNVPKPVSKYNLSTSKFSKSNSSCRTLVIDIDDSSDDSEVSPLPIIPASNSPKTEIEILSSDESIVCLNEKKPFAASSAVIKNLSSNDSSESDEEINEPRTHLYFNVTKEVLNDIRPNKHTQNRAPNVCQSRIIYSKHKPLSRKQGSCPSWTPEMTSFYDSDISEDLSVEDIHATQSDIPQHWKIIRDDFPMPVRFRYFSREVRCTRCRQFGHEERNCLKVPLCPLCGSSEHSSISTCPSRCCFRCGDAFHKFCPFTSYKIHCYECGMKGHHSKLCPDKWRRFHITTSGTTPIKESKTNENMKTPWCCNCSKKGHYGYECHYWDNLQRYVTVPTIINSYRSPFLSKNKQRENTDECENSVTYSNHHTKKLKSSIQDNTPSTTGILKCRDDKENTEVPILPTVDHSLDSFSSLTFPNLSNKRQFKKIKTNKNIQDLKVNKCIHKVHFNKQRYKNLQSWPISELTTLQVSTGTSISFKPLKGGSALVTFKGESKRIAQAERLVQSMSFLNMRITSCEFTKRLQLCKQTLSLSKLNSINLKLKKFRNHKRFVKFKNRK